MRDQVSTGTSETIALLNNRVSVRSFTTEPVSDELVKTILSAAFRAPTSSNIQSYSVIVVREQAIKEKLYEVTGKQQHILETPVFLAFCADLSRIELAKKNNGGDIDDNNLELGLVSSIDASLVGMSTYLAAESLGLKGVMIGAVRNNATTTAEILGLPNRVYCVFGMCLGWPDQAPPQKPRMDYATMVHYEQYGNRHDERDSQQALADYDAALAAHYTSLGKPTAPDSWSFDLNKKFVRKLRDQLREQLKGQGFDFR